MTDLAVARSFGRSAASYDAHARVQLAASKTLVDMLPCPKPSAIAVDIGAGTMPMARPLQALQPRCTWLALDISAAMLREAQVRGRLDRPWQPVCADAEKMPFASASIDLAYSCFALQWCSTPEVAVAEIVRVLKPGGCAVIAVPVAGSLREFRDSWQQVDGQTHFNTLPQASQWTASAGGLIDYHQQLTMREHYTDVRAIADMLKLTGADHVRRAQAPGLITPARYRRLVDAYEKLREPQGLPLSWEVLFLSLRKQEE